MTNKVDAGSVFEFLLLQSEVWLTEKRLGTFCIFEGTKVLVLEEREKRNLYKILILTGKHTGKVCFELSSWLEDNEFYKEL